ncbi:MAG: sugar dehydrogenase complex small subunit [Burkholderiales bacterium]
MIDTQTAASADRRRLLQGLAALVASGAVPAAFAQGAPALSAAGFSAMAKTLAGYAFGDQAVATAMLRALASAIGAASLSKIADLASAIAPDQLSAELKVAGLDKAAATVVTALFAGVVETPKGPVVITYDSALAWQAVPWTKPNAECGGLTNYWAQAPKQS